MAEINEVTLKVDIRQTFAETGQKVKSTFLAINPDYLA